MTKFRKATGKTLTEVANEQGISKQAIYYRMKCGWTFKEIINPNLRLMLRKREVRKREVRKREDAIRPAINENYFDSFCKVRLGEKWEDPEEVWEEIPL